MNNTEKLDMGIEVGTFWIEYCLLKCVSVGEVSLILYSTENLRSCSVRL